jgi:DNA primase
LQKRGHEAFSACLRESVKFMDFVFARVLQRGPVASIDEKVERAGEMLAFIEKLPSGIERDYYIKKTAEALDVDEAVLRQETAARTHASSVVRGAAKSAGPAKSQRPRAEEMLIHLMLKDEDVARDIKAQIGHQDFTDPLYRRAAEKIFDELGKNKKLDINELLRDGDEELGRLFAQYSVLDVEYGDPEKTCRDCVDRIKQQGHTKRMKALSAAIKDAESRGDAAELRRLLGDQQQLLQSRRLVQGSEAISKTGH